MRVRVSPWAPCSSLKRKERVMDTLVLSHAYVPVARVGWKRAVTLLFEGKVEVIEEYEDRTVRSVTLEFKVPSIIRFLRKIRDRKRAVKFSRENVYARDKGLLRNGILPSSSTFCALRERARRRGTP